MRTGYSAQIRKKDSRALQIVNLEALGKPMEDRREELAPIIRPSLPSIQLCHAYRRTQLPAQPRLCSGHFERSCKAFLGRFRIFGQNQDLSLDAEQFRSLEKLARLLDPEQPVIHHRERFRNLPATGQRFR